MPLLLIGCKGHFFYYFLYFLFIYIYILNVFNFKKNIITILLLYYKEMFLGTAVSPWAVISSFLGPTKRVETWLYLYEDHSSDAFRRLSDPLLCVYLLYWVEKTWRKRSWMSISYLSLLFSGWFCLNYWFVENAIRVHCGLRQSQTIVQHRSAFFFRPFLF